MRLHHTSETLACESSKGNIFRRIYSSFYVLQNRLRPIGSTASPLRKQSQGWAVIGMLWTDSGTAPIQRRKGIPALTKCAPGGGWGPGRAGGESPRMMRTNIIPPVKFLPGIGMLSLGNGSGAGAGQRSAPPRPASLRSFLPRQERKAPGRVGEHLGVEPAKPLRQFPVCSPAVSIFIFFIGAAPENGSMGPMLRHRPHEGHPYSPLKGRPAMRRPPRGSMPKRFAAVFRGRRLHNAGMRSLRD